MAYWLFKTEPDEFSWDMLIARGAKGEPWSGVRNFTARGNMKAMGLGDRGFFYHTGEDREVVGICEVIALAHPDPTDDTGVWEVRRRQGRRARAQGGHAGRGQGQPKAQGYAARQIFAPLRTAGHRRRVGRGLPHGRARCRESRVVVGEKEVSDAVPARAPAAKILTPDECARFIRANTCLIAPPLVPEILLHLAEECCRSGSGPKRSSSEMNVPPPYWAFAWAGGQALARYLLDNPTLVAGRSVLDLGSGSGLTAIAAARADAASVLAADIDRFALAAIALNAVANAIAVAVDTTGEDLLALAPPPVDVVLVGDLFYERAAGRPRAGLHRESGRRRRAGPDRRPEAQLLPGRPLCARSPSTRCR